jgi:hypothetical protein
MFHLDINKERCVDINVKMEMFVRYDTVIILPCV